MVQCIRNVALALTSALLICPSLSSRLSASCVAGDGNDQSVERADCSSEDHDDNAEAELMSMELLQVSLARRSQSQVASSPPASKSFTPVYSGKFQHASTSKNGDIDVTVEFDSSGGGHVSTLGRTEKITVQRTGSAVELRALNMNGMAEGIEDKEGVIKGSMSLSGKAVGTFFLKPQEGASVRPDMSQDFALAQDLEVSARSKAPRVRDRPTADFHSVANGKLNTSAASALEGSLRRKTYDRDWIKARGNTTAGTYDCHTNHSAWTVNAHRGKGVALDDDTFEGCSNKIPVHWPGTNQPVTSIRLFKPWGLTQPRIFQTNMTRAWEDLKIYTELNNVEFLVGVSVTCNEQDDDREWQATMDFLKIIGAQHVMGLAIGNEADIAIAGESTHLGCRHKMFNRGGYLERLSRRVEDFDTIEGMSSKPVTMVLSAMGLTAKNTRLIQGAWEKYGSRFVASFNLYPQFSYGLSQAGCQGSVDVGTKFTMDAPAGFVPAVIKAYRTQMDDLGWSGMKLWITEMGWSTHSYCVLGCSLACSEMEAQKRFYQNFLDWDLSAGGTAADHVFFFTFRNSRNFDDIEAFGLIGACEDTECKF